MATRSSHNKNNSAIKRIMQEARELADDPSTDYSAAPLEDDIFEWHCTLRGPVGTEFEGGLYHFRILLPAEYPFRPPSIMMLTPSGRFEINTKICISFTSYHEELWQPAWGVRTAIIGLQGFFPLKGQAAVGVGAIEAPVSERKRLAKLSRTWVCPECKMTTEECLPDPPLLAAIESTTPLDSKGSDTSSSLTDAINDTVAPPSFPSAPLTPSDSPQHTTPHEATRSSEQAPNGSLNPQPASWTSTTVPEPPEATVPVSRTTMTMSVATSPRPPILLDTAIGLLLILVAALLAKKVF